MNRTRRPTNRVTRSTAKAQGTAQGTARRSNSITKRTKARTNARTKARGNALNRRRTKATPVHVPEPMPVFVPEPRIETNLMRQVEAENAGRLQTADCNVTYPLYEPFVRYRPEGYTVQLEAMLHNPREVILVTFPEPINLFRDFDVKKRAFMRDYIAFYRSTASSTTSILPELRNTWFPTFGLIPNYHIMKISSLEPGNYSWKANLDMFVRVEQMLDRAADRKISPYVYMFGIQNDPELLIKELASRTSSWQFLRISAAIGGGIWDIERTFRDFVLTRNFVDRNFIL